MAGSDRNEAKARIKINKLLEEAGWRFDPRDAKPANIQLEHGTTITLEDTWKLGDDFQGTKKGFIDFLLLDERGFPFIVLEAKSEGLDPLVGKEQARKYARSQNCRFVILSNGNLHYFWDLERGSPAIITSFPRPDSVMGYSKRIPVPERLSAEVVEKDYIALTQRPNYAKEAGWLNEDERPEYIKSNALRFLRPYQVRAVHAVQQAVKNDNKDRFLFEMATGTGKTLLSAAVIKLFLRTGNANRVLFLVDRLELERQAKTRFDEVLQNDFTTIIYKEQREDWRRAEIVVTTVQSLLFNNKYRQLFSPTDFDLVISDEAHRSIGGNARAVFDYFIGYKLGLTATPRDYLKNFDRNDPTTRDPREYERRVLLDTYRTFGCEDGQPTFRYSLNDGVRDGYLISPTVIDARTDITTQLLSDEGFVVTITDDESGAEEEQSYKHRQFEKKFFAGATNALFCKTFLENALRDPVTGEIGKSIVFAVSQRHAGKLAQILNEMADRMFPGKYQSDFAVQVTSSIPDAQQMTINFANNTLLGSANFLDTYRTSKARVCVTVGMMTTGYDCEDLLNLAFMRPVFSPTDFIQMKGRGTRKHDFRDELHDEDLKATLAHPEKTTFKLFDFFANCEYFEEDFDYDEVLKLPKGPGTAVGPDDDDDDDGPGPGPGPVEIDGAYEHLGADVIASIKEEHIGAEGMKIDRMFFQRFEDTVRDDPAVVKAVEAGKWDQVIDYINREVFDKPDEFYNLEKLRRAAAVDRRITLREILEKVFGLIPRFKSKNDLLEEEFGKFIADHPPDGSEVNSVTGIKHFFKAYATSDEFRHFIENKAFANLVTYAPFSMNDYRQVPERYRTLVPEYIKDYVNLNQFVA